MQFSDFVENNDGSCTVKVDMTPEETKQLIEYALVHMLKEGSAKVEKECSGD